MQQAGTETTPPGAGAENHEPVTRLGDFEVEQIVGNLLRVGVLLAAAVVLAGGVFFLVTHGLDVPDYRVFHGEPSDFTSVAGVLREALALNPRGIIALGLLLLIATPIARVIFSIVAFAIERDRMYILVTLIVLAVLLFGLLGGAKL